MPRDEGGLLGDLPRERPGTRSPKRSARPAQRPAEPTEPEPAAPTAGELATEPLRLAVGAAEAVLGIASRATGELIRRLPKL
jgi:hypothetical protein